MENIISKERLNKIVQEELENAIKDGNLSEGFLNRLMARAKGGGAFTGQVGSNIGKVYKAIAQGSDKLDTKSPVLANAVAKGHSRMMAFNKKFTKMITDMTSDLKIMFGSNFENMPEQMKQHMATWAEETKGVLEGTQVLANNIKGIMNNPGQGEKQPVRQNVKPIGKPATPAPTPTPPEEPAIQSTPQQPWRKPAPLQFNKTSSKEPTQSPKLPPFPPKDEPVVEPVKKEPAKAKDKSQKLKAPWKDEIPSKEPEKKKATPKKDKVQKKSEPSQTDERPPTPKGLIYDPETKSYYDKEGNMVEPNFSKKKK